MIFEVVNFVNLRRTMYKLQTALCKNGVFVKINQKQNYFEEAGRMVTKYIVKIGKETVLETYKQAEVVKTLAEMYGNVKNG